jgi:hypothetical protein
MIIIYFKVEPKKKKTRIYSLISFENIQCCQYKINIYINNNNKIDDDHYDDLDKFIFNTIYIKKDDN